MSEIVPISLHVPKYQKEYCDSSSESIKDLYINAFDTVYLKNMKRISEIKELEEKISRLKKELEKEKNRPFTYKELKYLKESKYTISKGTKEHINSRFKSFQRLFNRYYMNIEDFVKKVGEVA